MNYSNLIKSRIKEYDNLNKQIIEENINTILNLSENQWSINQIIGHLIDSACNNHQRIIRLKNENDITFPDYNKDIWLANQQHNKMSYINLYNLFYYYNILISEIVKDINEIQKANIWKIKWEEEENISLEKLIMHYIEHLEIHYNHLKLRINELRNNENKK